VLSKPGCRHYVGRLQTGKLQWLLIVNPLHVKIRHNIWKEPPFPVEDRHYIWTDLNTFYGMQVETERRFSRHDNLKSGYVRCTPRCTRYRLLPVAATISAAHLKNGIDLQCAKLRPYSLRYAQAGLQQIHLAANRQILQARCRSWISRRQPTHDHHEL
jgi:hypothetical protein